MRVTQFKRICIEINYGPTAVYQLYLQAHVPCVQLNSSAFV